MKYYIYDKCNHDEAYYTGNDGHCDYWIDVLDRNIKLFKSRYFAMKCIKMLWPISTDADWLYDVAGRYVLEIRSISDEKAVILKL